VIHIAMDDACETFAVMKKDLHDFCSLERNDDRGEKNEGRK
jgi:hypothetical protein